MQTALFVVGIVGIVVFVGAFVILVWGVLRELRKIGQTTQDVSRFLATAEEELTSTTQDIRTALNDADKLTVDLAKTVERVDSIAEGVERIIEGTYVATAAVRAVKSSTGGLISVYEGIKQGIMTLCGSQESKKEGITDEQ